MSIILRPAFVLNPAFVLIPALLLGGCASRTYRLDAVGPAGDLGREARYVLESAEGNEGSVTLAAVGKLGEQVDGRETDTVRVLMTVDNASDDPIRVPFSGVQLKDDEGRSWRSLSVSAPGGASDELAVGPRERLSAEILYDSGAPRSLLSTGSVTVNWGYEYRGERRNHETRFLPVRYQYVAYPGYDPFWYGWGWGGGWGGGNYYGGGNYGGGVSVGFSGYSGH